MRAKVNFITLGVDDLERSLRFYRDGLGWSTEGVVGSEFHDEVSGADGTIAFFAVGEGLLLGLYERDNLAKDAGLPVGPASSTEVTIGLVAKSEDEVDAMLEEARAVGAAVTGPPHLRPFGVYSGHFADPDGHVWEVAWNAGAS